MLSISRNLLAIAAFAITLTACSEDFTSPISNATDASAKQIYVVEFANSSDNSTLSVAGSPAVNQLLNDYNIDTKSVKFIYTSVLNGFAAELSYDEMRKIANDRRVKLVEADVIQSSQGSDGATVQGQSTPWGISRVGGFTTATSNTGVAWVVDTGIDLDHPDLNVDVARSRSFVLTLPDKNTPDDLNGHGSHVAGIIAAKNNDFGVVGVCAGATVISVKILNQYGSGRSSQTIAGLDYVANNLVANKVNVVNMSFTGSISTTVDAAVRALAAKGAKIAIAAGNYLADVANYSPARVDAPNVYTISAYSSTSALASFSNYGLSVDYSAPGVSIYSCNKNGGYTTKSGTSMASPHFAGLLLADNGTTNWSGYITGDLDSAPDKISIK